MWREYTKRPVTIRAVQLTADNARDVARAVGGSVKRGGSTDGTRGIVVKGITIPTLEGTMTAKFGDYVIEGVSGEFYPCKEDIFHATYDDTDG